MAREYSDPGIAPIASKMVGQGVPGQVAPRAPIPTVAPDEGPIMNPVTATPSVYIPGASRHEVVYIDEGQADTVTDYPIGTGSWQSRSHGGHVPPSDGPDAGAGASKPKPHPAVSGITTTAPGDPDEHI